MIEPPLVSVVVPTTDRHSAMALRCFESLNAHTPHPFELIIEEGSREEGYTAKINRGLARATGEFLVCSNDDVEVLHGWWQPLEDALYSRLDVAFPLTVAATDGGTAFNRFDLAAWHFAFHREVYDQTTWVDGVAARPFLDPDMRIWYSDTDLLIRLRLLGLRVGCESASMIRHGLSRTIGAWDCSAIVAEDRAAFERKWSPLVRSFVAVPT